MSKSGYKDQRRLWFKDQRCRAKQRGIEFHLTFEEWLSIWEDSGKFHLRGCRRGQYVMSRFGDKGPYAVWNVEIKLHSENLSEGHLGKPKPSLIGNKHAVGRRSAKKAVATTTAAQT